MHAKTKTINVYKNVEIATIFEHANVITFACIATKKNQLSFALRKGKTQVDNVYFPCQMTVLFKVA